MVSRLDEMLDPKNNVGRARLRSKALTELGVYTLNYITLPGGGFGQVTSVGLSSNPNGSGNIILNYMPVEIPKNGKPPEGVKVARENVNVLGISFYVGYASGFAEKEDKKS